MLPRILSDTGRVCFGVFVSACSLAGCVAEQGASSPSDKGYSNSAEDLLGTTSQHSSNLCQQTRDVAPQAEPRILRFTTDSDQTYTLSLVSNGGVQVAEGQYAGNVGVSVTGGAGFHAQFTVPFALGLSGLQLGSVVSVSIANLTPPGRGMWSGGRLEARFGMESAGIFARFGGSGASSFCECDACAGVSEKITQTQMVSQIIDQVQSVIEGVLPFDFGLQVAPLAQDAVRAGCRGFVLRGCNFESACHQAEDHVRHNAPHQGVTGGGYIDPAERVHALSGSVATCYGATTVLSHLFKLGGKCTIDPAAAFHLETQVIIAREAAAFREQQLNALCPQ